MVSQSVSTHAGGPLDEAQTLLDDHIIKSRAMSASPFAKPFAAEITPWVARLTRLSAILEQWLTCQVQRCALAYTCLDLLWTRVLELALWITLL